MEQLADRIPRVGMEAVVRNRRGVISDVEAADGCDGRLHLVHIEYVDGDDPRDERLLWEREPKRALAEPATLPDISLTEPMDGPTFDAMVRAARWSAMVPFLSPGNPGEPGATLVASPFHAAVQIEDFQLVPLIKALRMPRVSLLIADDVGVGKTIEAGLILSELMLRRRVQRVLILTPASLRAQWHEEMLDKFALLFEIVDRGTAHSLRRRVGLDANPWRSFPRIIASYHYLRQPDVLTEFVAAARAPDITPQLPWDLLIVDEVHNLAPSPFGEDSDLCTMLRHLVPLFEHRIFLTATPHNGHTRSFTGLLELLDPVRFAQADELKPATRRRIEQVVVRRLKREINRRTDPPRFCDRLPPRAVVISLHGREQRLAGAFDGFRRKVACLISRGPRSQRLAGTFGLEVLGKRLLSCPVAFAESWRRCKAGMHAPEVADDVQVLAAQRSMRDDIADDREAERRGAAASRIIGGWLKSRARLFADDVVAIDKALAALGLATADRYAAELDPTHDARLDALVALIADKLRANGRWRDDERLVVFTEYKTTLDYLARRLQRRYGGADRVLTLFGGMAEKQREAIKLAFNDPQAPARILVATDAASEGLNLQTTARYLLHFDVPWNPARLEQRNGRLDRHGQARPVTIHHFATDDDQDLAFLAHVVAKVNTIREDLGSTGQLFDEAIQRRLIEGESRSRVEQDLDRGVATVSDRDDIPGDDRSSLHGETGLTEADQLDTLAAELDFDPTSLRGTLEAAMALGYGFPRLSDPDEHGRVTVLEPHPASWTAIIDQTLRRRGPDGEPAALAFDQRTFIDTSHGRPLFRPRHDTVMLHLAHPMIRRALGLLARLRFASNTGIRASRWVVRRGGVPPGHDALILLTCEELAVNELRETFHHWVRTDRLPVKSGTLLDPLPHVPARALCGRRIAGGPGRAREIWKAIARDVEAFIDRSARALTARLRTRLSEEGAQVTQRELERYQSQQGEVSALIEQQTLKSLARQIERLKIDRLQGRLFDPDRWLDEIDRSTQGRQRELDRRRSHYGEVREQLARERDRMINDVLPRRYTMRGSAQVFAVAVEIRLPD